MARRKVKSETEENNSNHQENLEQNGHVAKESEEEEDQETMGKNANGNGISNGHLESNKTNGEVKANNGEVKANGVGGEVKEVLFEGNFYDVTTFIQRHPGGGIINYYTEPGEDATAAMQQFHHRSMDKIRKILKSFKKRPAQDEEILQLMDAEQLKRHRAITADFTELHIQLEKEGYFEPSYSHNIYRVAEVITMGIVGYKLLGWDSLAANIFGVFLLGLAQGRSGWIQHESGHHSLTGKPNLDRFFHAILYAVGLGLSSTWWRRSHNRHHSMPQRVSRDFDMETYPINIYNKKVAKTPQQGKTWLIQNQAALFLPIGAFLGMLSLKFYMHPKFAMRSRLYFEILTMLTHYVLIAYSIGFWPYLFSSWFMSVYLIAHFALSHTHLPAAERSTHWCEYSLNHTCNISIHSSMITWTMGYLNFQIEHHLFPTMPQFKHPLIADRVKVFAKKHNIPYIELTYFEAFQRTLGNMAEVSKELKTWNHM